MLDKKLKDQKIKADEDPDLFWQKLPNLNTQMEKIGKGLTERRLIDIVIETLPPSYSTMKFKFIRDSSVKKGYDERKKKTMCEHHKMSSHDTSQCHVPRIIKSS